MKKNRMMRLASILLVCVLLSTSVISGTFAKYITHYDVTDHARVARFDVSAFGEKADNNTKTVTVDIFDQSKVYDTLNADYSAGVDDVEIKNGVNDGIAIIAPGSWGTFNFTVKNDSEVTVEYDVEYTATEAGVPLEWSADGSNWATDLTDITDKRLDMGTAETVTIYWRWVFTATEGTGTNEKRDTADTALGMATTLAEPSLKIDVTITQVD